MTLPEAYSLEFNLLATAFFLVFAVAPQQSLNVASLGRVKKLSPKAVLGWRIFAGFFATVAALMAAPQLRDLYFT